MNDRLNRAVERLLLDKRFLRRFRRNPEAALKPFGLTSEEIAAVKDGDASRLVGLGLDPSYVWPKPRPRPVPLWALARAKKLTPAFVLAALVLPATPALAARRDSPRSPVGRVSRHFARRGFGGEFHQGLARTGRAGGRVVSRAASRRDASAFVARARGAARDLGIQPPPGDENT